MPNVLTQKIILKTEEYSRSLKKIQGDFKSSMKEFKDGLLETSKSFKQNEDQAKQWGKSVGDELKKVGQSFKDNLATGAKAMTLGAGALAFKKGLEDATDMVFDLSEVMSELGSKANVSASQMSKWKDSFSNIASKVGTNAASIAKSFDMMYNSVGDKDELMNIISLNSQAAVLGRTDPAKMTANLMSAMEKQGKKPTLENAKEFYGASDVLRRKGAGVGNLDKTTELLSGIDTRQTGMNIRQIANLMAAATKTVGGENGADAIKGLLSSTLTNKAQIAVALGLNYDTKTNQIDASGVGGKQFKDRIQGMGSAKMDIMQQLGLSENQAKAFADIAESTDTFGAALKDAASDTKDFQQSAKEGSKNLKVSYEKMMSGITGMFTKAANFLHLDDVAGNTMETIGNNPVAAGAAIVGGGLLTGALIKSLGAGIMGKIPGLGTATELTKSVGIGNALKAAGVTPVYVVNASDIGGNSSMTGKGITDLLGGSLPGEAAKKLPFMTKLGSLLGGAVGIGQTGVGTLAAGGLGGAATIGGGVVAAGAVGYGIGSLINEGTSAIGDKFDIPSLGVAIYDLIDKLQNQKIEVDSKDPQFSARPKANDNQKDGRSQ